MSDSAPSDEQEKLRKDATNQVSLVALLVCMAAAAVFYMGAAVGSGWPAALAVAALSAMGFGMSYLILRRA